MNQDVHSREVLAAAHETAIRVVERIAEHMPERSGSGAHFRSYFLPDQFAGHRFAQKLTSGWVGGNANREKEPEYRMNTGEKFYRGVLRLKFGEHSSFPTRDPQHQMWGGAVFIRCHSPEWGHIWIGNSTSGLPECGDETTGLLMPRFAGWKIDFQIVKIITDASNNVLARNLFREIMPESVNVLGEMEPPEAEAACLIID